MTAEIALAQQQRDGVFDRDVALAVDRLPGVGHSPQERRWRGRVAEA